MLFLIITPIIIVLGILFYCRSVNSRKYYRCPDCGERVRAELGRTSHCPMCGTQLERDHSAG